MKEFSWENLKEHASPQRFNWYNLNHDQPITEEQYVEAFQMFKNFTNCKGKPSGSYSPSRARKSYRFMKETHGFFKS